MVAVKLIVAGSLDAADIIRIAGGGDKAISDGGTGAGGVLAPHILTGKPIAAQVARGVDITKTWAQNVALMGMDTNPFYDYVFGTGVTPGAGQTKIGSTGDLTTNNWTEYAPFPADGGQAKLNGEPEIYMRFNSTNYVFNSDHLALTATLDGGQTCTPTVVAKASGAVHLDGSTATPVANLGLTVTAGIVAGQLVGVPQPGVKNGIYIVKSLITDTSVTIGTIPGCATSTADVSGNRVILFLPYYAYQASAQSSPDGSHTKITFAGKTIPAGVINGMIVTQITGGGNWQFMQSAPWTDGCTITAVTLGSGGDVTVTPPIDGGIAITDGLIVMGPKIRSGSIYKTDVASSLMPGRGGINAIARELVFKGPATNGYVPPGGGITQAQFNAMPATAPLGAWLAYWSYGNYNAQLADPTLWYDKSELDFLEENVSCNIGNKTWGVTLHGGGDANNTDNLSTYWPIHTTAPLGGLANPNDLQYNLLTFNSTDMGDGAWHTIGMIWTLNKIYVFIDGRCVRWGDYNWSSLCPPWIAMNFGCGALGGDSIAANMNYPVNSSAFPMAYRIQRERLLIQL